MKKRIMRAMPDAAPVELASFELRTDGTIEATYNDELLRDELEGDGAWSLATGWVRPTDGRKFWDALDTNYSQSSFMYVTTEAS